MLSESSRNHLGQRSIEASRGHERIGCFTDLVIVPTMFLKIDIGDVGTSPTAGIHRCEVLRQPGGDAVFLLSVIIDIGRNEATPTRQ